MLGEHKKHMGRVALYGGGLCAAAAAAGYFIQGGGFAFGVAVGGALSMANIYSIIMLVETVAGVALGEGTSSSTKAFAVVLHLIKLILIIGIIALLVITRSGDLLGIIAGFTVVLAVHGVAGLMKARENLVEEALEAAEEEEDA